MSKGGRLLDRRLDATSVRHILITRVGGTETLSVSNFTLDGQDKRTLAQSGSFTFAVGADITVPAGTVDGVYTGEIDVTIQYP